MRICEFCKILTPDDEVLCPKCKGALVAAPRDLDGAKTAQALGNTILWIFAVLGGLMVLGLVVARWTAT